MPKLILLCLSTAQREELFARRQALPAAGDGPGGRPGQPGASHRGEPAGERADGVQVPQGISGEGLRRPGGPPPIWSPALPWITTSVTPPFVMTTYA